MHLVIFSGYSFARIIIFCIFAPKKVFLNNSVMEQNQLKEVPYGVSDFDVVRRDNLYYVDKTMYLPKLESQARNLFFIRPRRFGKSLFCLLYTSDAADE